MKVKDIILRALAFAGRDDVVKAVEEGNIPEGETSEAVKTALLCFNAVEDELARCYIPIKKTEEFTSSNGEIEFSVFSERPLKILSVKSGGVNYGFEVTSDILKTSAGAVTVEYNFAPSPKNLEDDSTYSEMQAGLSLIAAGTASEFCLISGDAGAADVWEKRYRREIDAAQRRKYGDLKIPPRRWV